MIFNIFTKAVEDCEQTNPYLEPQYLKQVKEQAGRLELPTCHFSFLTHSAPWVTFWEPKGCSIHTGNHHTPQDAFKKQDLWFISNDWWHSKIDFKVRLFPTLPSHLWSSVSLGQIPLVPLGSGCLKMREIPCLLLVRHSAPTAVRS